MNGDGMLGEESGGSNRVGGCNGYLGGCQRRGAVRRRGRCGWLSMGPRFDLLVSFSFLLLFGWTLFFGVRVAFGMAFALAVLCILYSGIQWRGI